MNSRYIQIIVISTFFPTIFVYADVESLKSSLSDELDPLHDTENSAELVKDQEKRTIFNLGLKNVAWVKHTALKPSGAKYVLGYAPVDLKLKPAIRPIAIKHQGYHYNKPRIHFHIKRPVVIKPVIETGWKPIIKPVVPIVKPINIPAPIHVVKPIKPIHVDHIHAVKPVHLDHVHVEPAVHVDQLHLNPVPHVDHIHQEPVVHVDHIHPVHITDHVHHVTTGHIDHLHHVSPPHVHAVHPGVVHTPFVPSAQLFEVTKPDLGVLPLGATFPTTALKEIPAPQLVQHPVHVHPVAHFPVAAAPIQVAPAPFPIFPSPVPIVPSPVPIAPSPVPIAPPPIPVAQVPVASAPVPTGPLHHVHPISFVHPAQVPVTHLHPVNHVHPVGHGYPTEAVPVGHVHQDYIYPVGQLHQDHIHPVGHLHQNHIHPVGQPYPVEHVHPINGHPDYPHLDHLHSDHIHPLGHLHPVGPPQPGVQVDYHGTHLLNSLGPVAPEQPPVQQLLPNHYNFQYPQIPQNQVPANDGSANFYPNQQQPQFLDAGQSGYPQQFTPEQSQFNGYPNQFQPEQNIQDHYPNVQEENRFQQANQVSSQHFFRDGQFQIGNQNEDQGYVYQQPSSGRFIQPGQTDLQFPLHLPNHPNFNVGYEQDNRPEASMNHERIFKPSIQLEPPFKK